jgi:hypothetical protein
MSRLFRNPRCRLVLAAAALLATVTFVADAGATRAALSAHYKPHKGSKKKKPPKKRPRPVKKGTKKAPMRAVRPPRPAAPAVRSAPVVPPKPPVVVPPKPPVVPPVVTPPVPPVTTIPPLGIGLLDVVTPYPSGARLFAPTSFWNRALPDGEPLDPRSDELTSRLRAEVWKEMTKVPASGPWINTNSWSVPVYTVGRDVPRVHVTLDVGVVQLQRDFDAVPIPANAHASAGTDRHLVIHQPSTDTFWEFWHAQKLADGWHAAWGGKMTNVSSNPGYFPNPLGASATSLPLLGGLATVAELKAGKIDHALAIAIPNTDAARVTWPAQRGDGRVTGATAIPQGTHFRIDPSVDLTKLRLTPVGLAMARAVQRYGMVVRDSSDCFTFYAEDSTTTSSNPYPQILGGLYPHEALRNFPWDRVQVVAPRKP